MLKSYVCYKDRFKTWKLINCLLGCAIAVAQSVHAQDSTSTVLTYDLSAEMAVGTGRYASYQLVTNRHHILSTRQNTGYVRGIVTAEHNFGNGVKLSGAIDLTGSVHADHKMYLQQCYANLSYKGFFVEAGAREEKPVLRNEELSSGAFAKGSNAKPIPQIHVGTNGFWTVPGTKKWLQVSADLGYGRLFDDDYKKDRFYNGGYEEGKKYNLAGDYNYVSDVYYHQKHLFLRSNPEKRFFVTMGMEHVAMFGGTEHSITSGQMVVKEKSIGLSSFTQVIVPTGDKNYHENLSHEDWIYGNHLGSWTIQLGWNIDKTKTVEIYHDRIFEDGSGMRLGNGYDGLWGVEYKNTDKGVRYVRGVVVEYFQSTHQSGPLHWDPNDYDEPIKSQITTTVTGMDNYYNHGFYNGYSYYGMSLGTALLTSPIYNEDYSSMFKDNRVRALHVAMRGEVTSRLSYIVKGSYREGLGSYMLAKYPKTHTFGAMLQANYAIKAWKVSAAYGFDKGNVYGNTSTLNVKIAYHGRLL